MNPKQRAAEAAVELIRSDQVVGLGTGTTAELFIRALAEAMRAGRLHGIRGVPTSRRSEALARELQIPLTTIAEAKQIDIDVDGADEIDPAVNLIKGMGGAMLREKVVAQNSTQMVVIADATKRVQQLGTRSALPVEVVEFEYAAQADFLRGLGCGVTLRRTDAGKIFRTDNGNLIYDCRFSGIDDPLRLEMVLASRAGIVETGLFLGMASMAIIADDSGNVETLTPPGR